MYDRRVKRLPVVDSAGRLAGIVSRTDILSVFSRPDEEIHNQITNDVILDINLMNPLRFRVMVKDGVVTMSGDPESALVGHEIMTRSGMSKGSSPCATGSTTRQANRCTPTVRCSEPQNWLEMSLNATSGTVPRGVYALLTDGTTAEIRPADDCPNSRSLTSTR